MSRDGVTIQLTTQAGYHFYWKPEDLLFQFENELRKLFERAGLRGVFEIKQAGRRISGDCHEGITLGQPSPYTIEFLAEYGNSGKKDVWTTVFDEKDTSEIHHLLTRALAGEVVEKLIPVPPPAKPKAELNPEEKQKRAKRRKLVPGEIPAPVSRFERDPVAMAYFLACMYGIASDRGYFKKVELTDILLEYYNFTEKRKASGTHRMFVSHRLLYRNDNKDSKYKFNPEGKEFVRKHREDVLALPQFQFKLRELEEKRDSYGSANPDGQNAARELLRMKELLEIE
jgi:hypothetical protein